MERGFRTRAASVLQPSIGPTGASGPTNSSRGRKLSGATDTPDIEPLATEKRQCDIGLGVQNKTPSFSSNDKTVASSGENAAAHDRDAQRAVRTIPTWVQVIGDEDEDTSAASRLLPGSPTSAQIAQHNCSPSSKQKQRIEPGRLYDSQRDSTPPFVNGLSSETVSRWRAFANASAYPAIPVTGGELVGEDWLVENGGDYSRPWLAGAEEGDLEKNDGGIFRNKARRNVWYKRIQHTILRSPLVPLAIRLVVWNFSLVAMALGASIRHQIREDPYTTSKGNSSSLIAIIVDAVALVYLVYITYDEYTGKPLGLRPAKAKMRLIFLDLFFIVFASANLSLAFDALTDLQGGCQHLANHCALQKALASVLLVELIAWLLTFAISVLRLMERVVR
ncbi:MAG: hypothetical protein FRX48_06375 [Lasallia pustulata]|uniref:Regulator of phospholipase D SRF1 n=1 Tax=Lasallia pustulata TaxID=136370 RepID=A0A5M8PJY5_9LECA|nr:MAG: hypothetical protein FRX48_06375 [Lasallia pustulata]